VEYFTVRNTVILALTQVGVIVAGVLGAGAVVKWHTTMTVRSPAATTLMVEYGYLALALPLAWTALALYMLRTIEHDESPGWLVFCTGVALLLLLLLAVGCGVVSPFLQMFGGSSGALSV
jgi:hypothetical protein